MIVHFMFGNIFQYREILSRQKYYR